MFQQQHEVQGLVPLQVSKSLKMWPQLCPQQQFNISRLKSQGSSHRRIKTPVKTPSPISRLQVASRMSWPYIVQFECGDPRLFAGEEWGEKIPDGFFTLWVTAGRELNSPDLVTGDDDFFRPKKGPQIAKYCGRHPPRDADLPYMAILS
ncbi:hypothetical protein R3P38DRAFT_2779692 [Favolaschia claudopus]|uniref:Uncharacterized protein n=1 Tax=Favolaschia claudopus TaxID=2862362 RepID=A0AAW0BBA5_9AGAR